MKIELNKSNRERIFHAVLFELLANIIIALFLAYVLQVSLLQSGMLSLISALTATVWNFIFNKIFDRLQRRYAFERSFLLLPLIDAFFVEIGLVLFFLPYTLAYNWLYDWLRWTFYGQKRMEETVE